MKGRFAKSVLCAAATAVVLLSTSMAGAQTTRPGNAPPAPAGSAPVANVATAASAGTTSGSATPKPAGESMEIVRRNAGAGKVPATNRSTTQNGTGGIETSRVALALGIVIAAILLMRFVGQKVFPASAGAKSSQVIRVLSRSAVAPKQQVLLMQVGRRLIVVGDCGTSMNPLAEITDPEEVAALVSQVAAEKSDSVTKAFGSLFGKARQPFESMSHADASHPTDDSADDDVDPAHDAPASPVHADHEAVSYARGEISGLADRIRVLSKQFKS